MSLVNLLDLLPSEMESLVQSLGAPRYRGHQLAGWIFGKGVTDLAAMSDLPRELRQALAERYTASPPEVERITPSQDGSRKLVLRLADGARIQSVLMPDDDRLTLCLSTQVGCGFRCAFCLTGTMGLGRNLTAGEIVGQVLAARETLPSGTRITHVVYMGMGEPLASYAATVKSLRILTDPHGFGFSPRRITVSTVGLVPGIEKLARENLRVNLAISLHATTSEARGRLMPVNRAFDLEALLGACRRFPLPLRQRMTFEYVLLDGVNDSAEDARRLVRLLRGMRAKVNLIPFNDWEGAPFQRPALPRILAFQAILLEHGIIATLRWSKGEDVGAACGQLKEAVAAGRGRAAAEVSAS
ncbi:MAG: 23S rRNA (adenine(2503)-C(2))-methyltransferase [Candidatus Rokubacteria bacterium GWC2_70_16]|nr:MAG: 23S rRNA (adenine(2503)-C(2))-methyltransferase [Candidatus Rokubacteria bacterium GWC2_70_16]OGL16874.1 MAG: 23S rRNA (adenine(2503)-C(2))-methyltransferase [Candidatus Rokubacteria bacterium RIFCSPLOWO2_12_FULL_71_19]